MKQLIRLDCQVVSKMLSADSVVTVWFELKYVTAYINSVFTRYGCNCIEITYQSTVEILFSILTGNMFLHNIGMKQSLLSAS
jgi:hypothetical protein